MANSPKSPMTRLNTNLGTTLALLAILSAIPVASARPSWWLLWSGVLAILAMIWAIQSSRLTPNRRMQSADLRPYLALAALVPLYALVQTLPLPFLPLTMNEGAEALAGSAISLLPSASWIGAIRFTAWIILFVLIYEVVTSRERMLRISWILFIGITLQAIWALLALRVFGDIALFGEKTSYFGSATGTFVNRNSLATFLGFGLLLGAGLLSRKLGAPNMRLSRVPNIFERIGALGLIILIAMALILLALVATQSRLGLFAGLVSLWITSLLLLHQNERLSKGIVMTSCFIALLFAAGVIALGQGGLSDRLIFVQDNADERLRIYSQTLDMIWHRPLLGFGFDAFGPAFEGFRTSELGNPVYYDLAHNSYLALWAEQGFIIGSIPPLLLLIAGWKIVAGLKSDSGFPVAKTVALGALILGAIHSLGDFSLEIPANTFVFIILIALGLAKRNQSKPQR